MKVLSRLATISDLDFVKDKNEFINLLNFKKYKMTPDGKVNVKGSLTADEIKRWVKDDHFIIKFGRVTGDFDCTKVFELKTLEGCPDRVDGNFYLRDCHKIKNLQYAPSYVGGDFVCNTCSSLQSFEGAPSQIKGSFICGLCTRFSSFEGITQKIGKDFLVSNCYGLESLKGCPKQINGDFRISFCNGLRNLEGAPKKVGGNCVFFNIFNLDSLKGAPAYVGGNFVCDTSFNLVSLEGSPKYVGGDYLCNNCEKLTFLDGLPEKLGGYFAINGEIIREPTQQAAKLCASFKTMSKVEGEIIEELGSFGGRNNDVLCVAKFDNGFYCVTNVTNLFCNNALMDKTPEKAIENFVEDIAYAVSEGNKEGSPRDFYLNKFNFGNGKYAKLYEKLLKKAFDEYGVY